MKNVVHKIYHLTFPCGKDYVGSTSLTFNKRYACHRYAHKISESPINMVSTQYKFKETNMIEVDRIECPMYDPKITILEEGWIKKLNPTLNIRKAYQTEKDLLLWKQEWFSARREDINKQIREYNKTPKGRLNVIVSNAKDKIRQYTKQNRPDMVKKWEGILEERIQNRLAHQSK